MVKEMFEFVEWVMTHGPWDGCDLHGGEVEDKALELGIIVPSPDRKDWLMLNPKLARE